MNKAIIVGLLVLASNGLAIAYEDNSNPLSADPGTGSDSGFHGSSNSQGANTDPATEGTKSFGNFVSGGKWFGGGDGDPCCDDPTILCYAPCSPDTDTLRSSAPGKGKIYRSADLEVRALQTEALAEINDQKISDPRLAALLSAGETEIWLSAGAVHIVNRGMNGRFEIRDAAAYSSLSKTCGASGEKRGTGILITGNIDAWSEVYGQLQEYGSWPPAQGM